MAADSAIDASPMGAPHTPLTATTLGTPSLAPAERAIYQHKRTVYFISQPSMATPLNFPNLNTQCLPQLSMWWETKGMILVVNELLRTVRTVAIQEVVNGMLQSCIER